jgi:DNA invertase Pin-like site-specific DNA recombinase
MTDCIHGSASTARDCPHCTQAIGYVRVSTESQALDGLGLDVQRDSIRALAEAEGLDLVTIYSDEGISGSEDVAGREGLADALDHLATGNATVLLIPKLDRLARDMMLQESILADVWKHNATVLSCSETERTYCQPDSADDPARGLIRKVLGAVAEYERAMIRARLVAGRRRRIALDGYAGGPEPYGWTDPDEQAILSHVADQRDRGLGWKAIADELNSAGLHKRNGAPWCKASIQRTYARAEQRTTIERVSLDLTPRLTMT